MTRLDDDIRAMFEAVERHPNVVPAQDWRDTSLPELQASWISAIEQGWIENVGSN